MRLVPSQLLLAPLPLLLLEQPFVENRVLMRRRALRLRQWMLAQLR
jgi:hypothetical protein